MISRCLAILVLVLSALARAEEIKLPPRPADAESGTDFAKRIAPLDPKTREEAIVTEVKRGNVPPFWRRFVAVKAGNAAFFVAPDYLAVGTDDDYFLAPLTPKSAQLIADEIDCVLPTRKMVDAIFHAAPLKLAPAPLTPSREMTTVPVFAQHNATVREQRRAALAEHPPGTLVAGHKKDVVLSPQLGALPNRVAIYGWHRAEGRPIQPLYLGHAATWADYSHGVRFVRREMIVNGARTTIDAVLADDTQWTLLSDEGPLQPPRYGEVKPVVPRYEGEKMTALFFEPGVRVMLNAPAAPDATKPTRLVLYALPAGNTIEQTVGRELKPGDDWHFNIQHIGAQTRWLRAHTTGANLVVAYLECAEKSWVLWRRRHAANDEKRTAAIVEALRKRFPQAKLTLTGHSAGGTFTFGYFDALEKVPDDIERIAFLDSNYAYDAAKGHATKLAQWMEASPEHRLVVLAYRDYVALLEGKTFVSEAGGTWGRSQAMLADLGAKFPFTRTDRDGLQHHTALDGRVEFLLKENPEKKILHTVQVELNGFIHAMLAGTEQAGKGYEYLGARTYEEFVARP